MTPQEYTMHVAKRLRAAATLVEGLAWCALVMRSWEDLDLILARAIETASRLRTSPVVPDPHAAEQARLLRALRRALQRKGGPDWAKVGALSLDLAKHLHMDDESLPSENFRLLDIFENGPPLPRLQRRPGSDEPRRRRAAKRKN